MIYNIILSNTKFKNMQYLENKTYLDSDGLLCIDISNSFNKTLSKEDAIYLQNFKKITLAEGTVSSEPRGGYDYNQIVNNLPEGITHLTFGKNYNQSLQKLPKSIIDITFGEKFNQPLINLPDGLKKISFYWLSLFNQRISAGSLPDNITSITFAEGTVSSETSGWKIL